MRGCPSFPGMIQGPIMLHAIAHSTAYACPPAAQEHATPLPLESAADTERHRRERGEPEPVSPHKSGLGRHIPIGAQPQGVRGGAWGTLGALAEFE